MWVITASISYCYKAFNCGEFVDPDEKKCEVAIESDTKGPDGYLADVEPDEQLSLRVVVNCGGESISGANVELGVAVKANTGGHHHHDYLRPDGKLQLSESGNAGKTVRGTTGATEMEVSFLAPSVAGDHMIRATCLDPTCDEEEEVTIWVGHKGFVRLPPSEFYVLIPNRDTEHPDNHYMTPDAGDRVVRIAKSHHEIFPDDPVLHLNDASLERGGMFDFSYPARQQYWRPPHQTHRDGRRIDIRANSLPTAIPEQNFDGFEMIVEDENCVAEIHNQGTNSQHYHMYCYEIGA